MPKIQLRKVDASNYKDILKLRVKDDQKNFVAPNDRSLLQSAYEAPDESTPYGVYDGETLVGFLLITSDEETPNTLWVWRLMIDTDHQGKGYGKAAMEQLKQQTLREGNYKMIGLSYVPENTVAEKLYASLGYVSEGLKEEWGEIVAKLKLT